MANKVDQQFLALMGMVLAQGDDKNKERTGTGTRSLFGHQMRFDLREGFPLITTKKVHLRSIIHELLWFIKGDTNIGYLKDNKVSIWDEWATETGELGPVYGEQWRSWKVDEVDDSDPENIKVKRYAIDQLQDVINELKTNPDSRRMLVSAWNPAVLPDASKSPVQNAAEGKQALPPCHTLFQFYSAEIPRHDRFELHRKRYFDLMLADLDFVKKIQESGQDLFHVVSKSYDEYYDENKADIIAMMDKDGIPSRYLSCQLYQRSADLFLGVPFNIASYALFTMMIAQVTGHVAKDFIHTFGDVHLYTNHFEQAKQQLRNEPFPRLPRMVINPAVTEIDGFTFDDFTLVDYLSHGVIAAPISV